MAQPLDAVPDGSDVLIDANLLVYGMSAKSDQCTRLLERCSREEITGVTLFETVNDATHQFMKAEALAKRLCTGKAMKYLNEHPEQVKILTEYWVNTQRILSLNLVFLPIEEGIVTGAHQERLNVGLLTNDSIIVAAMRAWGISRLASSDNQFE